MYFWVKLTRTEIRAILQLGLDADRLLRTGSQAMLPSSTQGSGSAAVIRMFTFSP
jgi:hypothetical protein